MKTSEIILNDKESIKAGADKVLATVGKFIKSGHGVLLKDNNSVLLLIRLGEGLVELHLFTLDKPLTVAKSIKNFIKKIRESDLKAVYGTAPMDSPVVQMLNISGVKVEKSNLPNYQWMAKV
jgi:hypothetical protein